MRTYEELTAALENIVLNKRYAEKTAGQEFLPYSERQTCSVCKACTRSRRKEKSEAASKNERKMAKKITSKGRIDADSRWWVAELLADCEKAWLQPGWEDIMQK